jgi:PAS domain S-box-containing protein
MAQRMRRPGDVGRLQWFLESVPEALLVVDERGRITLANSASSEVFGYAVEELVGLGIEVLIPERLRDGHVSLRKRYNDEPRDRPMGGSLDIVARRKDGSEFRADVELRSRTLGDERVVFASVRQRAASASEEQRQQRSLDFRRIVQLTRLTVEDVEELVAVILAAASRALESAVVDPASRDSIAEIRHAASLAAGLAEQLLGYVDEVESHADPDQR